MYKLTVPAHTAPIVPYIPVVLPSKFPDSLLLRNWIGALRSGKYTQTKHRLRDDNGFCCLGVACDVVQPALWASNIHELEEYEKIDWRNDGESTFLPHDVHAALGLPLSPQVLISINGITRVVDLTQLNDEYGCTFAQIADIIEYNIMPSIVNISVSANKCRDILVNSEVISKAYIPLPDNCLSRSWVSALRSGKYAQGKGQLRTLVGSFCCLGVLCDVKDGSKWHEDCSYGNNSSAWIPAEVQAELGVTTSDPVVKFSVNGNEVYARLTAINDFLEVPFNVIGDIIESNINND